MILLSLFVIQQILLFRVEWKFFQLEAFFRATEEGQIIFLGSDQWIQGLYVGDLAGDKITI